MTPTQRTLQHFRAMGWTIEVVERWIPHTRRRRDLFGFVDLVAMNGGETVAVQATSTSNLAHRVEKIRAMPDALAWVRGPHRRLYVVGWRKYAKPVERKRWRATVREITERDFMETTA